MEEHTDGKLGELVQILVISMCHVIFLNEKAKFIIGFGFKKNTNSNLDSLEIFVKKQWIS